MTAIRFLMTVIRYNMRFTIKSFGYFMGTVFNWRILSLHVVIADYIGYKNSYKRQDYKGQKNVESEFLWIGFRHNNAFNVNNTGYQNYDYSTFISKFNVNQSY